MSPHPEELLQIYIILGPFASSRSETGEIPAVLQDSLSGKSRPYRIAVFAQDFAYRIGVSGEIVQFCGFRLPDRRV
ncbi:hypothetical protein [Paenibacillus thiaminolyticus]|uniref:hypothetical protein n=1 Tax=Paenibacillus thiaminolyticus TaxID=49283 RepID=UPI0011C3C231|nr:hypothetical protein [Paenibacillus thiaminolyticus]